MLQTGENLQRVRRGYSHSKQASGLCKGTEFEMGTASLEDSKEVGLILEEGACRGTTGNQAAQSKCNRRVEDFKSTQGRVALMRCLRSHWAFLSRRVT